MEKLLLALAMLLFVQHPDAIAQTRRVTHHDLGFGKVEAAFFNQNGLPFDLTMEDSDLRGSDAEFTVLNFLPVPVRGAAQFSPGTATLIKNVIETDAKQHSLVIGRQNDLALVPLGNHRGQESRIPFSAPAFLPTRKFLKISDDVGPNIVRGAVAVIDDRANPSWAVLSTGLLYTSSKISALDIRNRFDRKGGISSSPSGKNDSVNAQTGNDRAYNEIERLNPDSRRGDNVANAHSISIRPLSTQIRIVQILGVIAIWLIFGGLWLTLSSSKRLRERGWLVCGIGLYCLSGALIILGSEL